MVLKYYEHKINIDIGRVLILTLDQSIGIRVKRVDHNALSLPYMCMPKMMPLEALLSPYKKTLI